MRRIYLLLFLFLFLWLVQASEEPTTLLDVFTETQTTLQENLISDGLAEAWVESASQLKQWDGYSDFLALPQRAIEPAYAAYRREDLVKELNRRLWLVEGSADWATSFDTGLLAMVAGRYVEAVTCFTEASLDPSSADNPYIQAYLGRAFLKLRNPDLARLDYEQAIRSASSDPPVRFQLNFMYAMDLYEYAQMGVALGEEGPIQTCLQSDYPLEKCFALYELLLHAWGEKDQVLIDQYSKELAAVIPNATPDTNSQYEGRRFKQASELLARVQSAQQGDDVTHMILDEESCDFDFKTNNHAIARERLKPWKEKYPLIGYKGLEEELKDAVTWVHLNYYVAEVLAGSPTIAELGFRALIEEVPFMDFPRKVVEAWLWLGYARQKLGDFSGAKTAYETGLSLDAADSLAAESDLTADFLQPRILNGKTRWQVREDFVKEYHDLLLILQAEGEQP